MKWDEFVKRVKSALAAAAPVALLVLGFLYRLRGRKIQGLKTELSREHDKDERAETSARVAQKEKEADDARIEDEKASAQFRDSLARRKPRSR